MFTTPQPPRIHLPEGWQGCVKSAVLHTIASWMKRVDQNGPNALLQLREPVNKFLLAGAIDASATPKYIICDKGKQFWCDMFKDWCERHGITPRFGAVGQHGSIAVIERFILSLKQECTRVIVIPIRKEVFHQ